MKIGYTRNGRALEGLGLELTFTDSGNSRTQLAAMLVVLAQVTDSHVFVGSMSDLLNVGGVFEVVQIVRASGNAITFIDEDLSVGADKQSDLIFRVIECLSQLDGKKNTPRATHQRVNDGVVLMSDESPSGGRRSAFSDADLDRIVERFDRADNKSALAEELGLSRSYLYKLVRKHRG